MNKLIYNFNEHGLYYQKEMNSHVEKIISLTISRLELDFDYKTGKLLTVTGFSPLTRAKKQKINIPNYIDGSFFVSMNEISYERGMAYDYFDFFLKVEGIS